MFKKDRKSTRLNSSHLVISYAVFCLKKKKTKHDKPSAPAPRSHVLHSVPPPPRTCCAVCSGTARAFFSCNFFWRSFFFFFFNDTATTEIYTLSLHDALPI